MLNVCHVYCGLVFTAIFFSSFSVVMHLQEEDFHEMINTAQIMDSQYGHLFEKVIVNDDLSAAFSELRLALQKVETEPHWVPVTWTHS